MSEQVKSSALSTFCVVVVLLVVALSGVVVRQQFQLARHERQISLLLADLDLIGQAGFLKNGIEETPCVLNGQLLRSGTNIKKAIVVKLGN